MSLYAELKRRNVVRVGLAYAVIGWVLAQIAEFSFENFGAPDWVLKTFAVLLLLGLPLALFFAWAFEVTPDGIKRERDVDRSQSIDANWRWEWWLLEKDRAYESLWDEPEFKAMMDEIRADMTRQRSELHAMI